MEVPILTRWIDQEEWYPVYELHREGSTPLSTQVHIPEDLVQRYAKAYAEFKSVQMILKSFYEEED